MKAVVIFVLCLVAMAAAAPQLVVPFNGFVDPFVPKTLIAGPTVINSGISGYRAGLLASGFGDYLCDNC